MKLFRSVLLLMLFASAVPTGVLGWMLSSTSRDQLTTDALELAAERVERLRLEAAGWLAEARRAVEDSARGTAWAGLDEAERREALSALLSRRQEVAVVTLFDRSGRKIRGLQGFPATVAPSEIAEHEVQAGVLLRQGLSAGGAPARWSPPYRAAHRGEAVMTLLVPLPDRAVGALAAELSLSPLQRLAARTRVGARGQAFVVDASGRYLAHPDPARVLAVAGEPEVVRELGLAAPSPVGAGGARVAQFRDASGRELLGAWAALPEVGWGVVAAQPRDDAFAAVDRMRRTVLYGGLVSAALAVLLSGWFARRIARPVSECVRGALDIARGRFGGEVKVTVRNEIGDLAYTFNHMSRELKSYDEENRRLIAKLEAGYLDTIRSLAGAIDAKDTYTRGHNQRVAELAVEIGRELECDGPTMKALAYGGILHDIGKIGIPEPVLRKSVPLSEQETAVMREHPAIGAEIVNGVEFLRDALPAIKSHHERWDGAGYPEGLAGERIPLVARIVNAADTWDACTSSRPYQPAMDVRAVLRILERLRGTQIDPRVMDALLAVVDRWTGGAISRARAG
ncbi:MAG TPA: HD domain-containing phosphohydrolase [Anaeromyxobacteraceae bacterium]|nr:HD domain-containing phosphohydrolase [Anaeromyxobacteraceae bacterium]